MKTVAPSRKEVRALLRDLEQGNPGLSITGGGERHYRVQAPGLRPVWVSCSPGKNNHVKQARRELLRAGYKL